MNKNKLFSIAVTALLLAACSPNAKSGFVTKTGTLRDTLFSVERLGSGATKVWVTHDDVAFYCVRPQDKEIGEALEDALLHHDGEVAITYSTLTHTGTLSDPLDNPCGYVGEVSYGSDFNVLINAYHIKSFEKLGSRVANN